MIIANPHHSIIAAIEASRPATEEASPGLWTAFLRIDTAALKSEEIALLASALVGEEILSKREYRVVVSDHHERAVQFSDPNEAMLQAVGLGQQVLNRYCFAIYSATGVTPDYKQKPTLHFMPGRFNKA